MKTELPLKNVMIIREGCSERRGEISAHTIACLAVNCLDKTVPLTHEGQLIGRIERIYIKDYPSHAELRGDIVFTDFKGLVALINEERFYPVSVTNKSTGIYSTYLVSAFFTTRDDCDFEGQQPLDLSDLRELVKGMEKSEAPGASLFRKRYDDVNSGFLGTLMLDRCGKIHFNENDTLEIEKGYLIFNTKDTVTAVKISEIEVIESIKNKDETENVFIRVASGTCAEMRNSNIGARDLIEILERYKESQLVALKAS
ncbi:hypothetical protein E2X29_16035 [Salmonella enterica]|nr:hypothetical protein [Salmonella enterica]EAT5603026.1 hypothetical protein [Salmonella enterica]EBP7651429.1 hypothetical protein [Salmonella enterica]EBP9100836.1 hypothetical protein [Salmonella enterica]ECP0373397.1 hypothetical protein [Salmonella enterica]